MDLCFELATEIMARIGEAVEPVDEVHGSRYFDNRDLIGFVDGTENPEGEAAVDAVLIGEEDRAFSGGSDVMVQKYLLDLDGWNALPTEEQEGIIGRKKLSNVEPPHGSALETEKWRPAEIHSPDPFPDTYNDELSWLQGRHSNLDRNNACVQLRRFHDLDEVGFADFGIADEFAAAIELLENRLDGSSQPFPGLAIARLKDYGLQRTA